VNLNVSEATVQRGGRQLLDHASLAIEPGSVHALLGPNGAGKSTLLRLLSGELMPDAGHVQLNGRALRDWSPREIARQRAVLPQQESLRFGFTVEQVIALGRMPCPQHAAAQEMQLVHEAMQTTDILHLAGRRYPSLSGGERARVQLARTLAQIREPVELGPRYLLLDEPTAALDLSHQHACMRLARRLAEQGIGVLAILHDPNLALGYADELSVLCCGQILAYGAPADVVTPELLQRIFGVRATLLRHPGRAPYVAVEGPADGTGTLDEAE
jgi:iron complex transport system ATP-binding protein